MAVLYIHICPWDYLSINFFDVGAHEFFILVKRIPFNIILAVVRSAVGVVTPPGELIRFPPTVRRVRCVSDFYGRILSTILP